MTLPVIRSLAVIGVGLIGGSFSLALRESGTVARIIGIDSDADNLAKALELGLIDDAAPTLSEGVSEADVVFVAVPVRSIRAVVLAAAPFLPDGCIVTDGGSVKDEVVRECESLMPEGRFFVGGHPIAGTEHSGASAAFSTLFRNKRCILTPVNQTDSAALLTVKKLWEATGSRVEMMDPLTHDRIFAAVSHLPHLVAYALIHAVDRSAEEEESILAFSAGGFRDFTRIASSDPVMWRDIALMNRQPLMDMLDRYALELDSLRSHVASGDANWLEEFFRTSKRLRDEIQ